MSGSPMFHPFIRSFKAENITLTGGGLIDGQGSIWWSCAYKKNPPCSGYSRPHLIMFVNSQNGINLFFFFFAFVLKFVIIFCEKMIFQIFVFIILPFKIHQIGKYILLIVLMFTCGLRCQNAKKLQKYFKKKPLIYSDFSCSVFLSQGHNCSWSSSCTKR